MAEDFTVKGGSIGHANAAKRNRLVRIAAEQRLPLVIILDGAGERASNSAERYPNTPNDLQLVCDLKWQVPVVTMVMGVSAGHGALTGMFADFIVMLEGAALFTAGPPLVQASLGITTTPEELGSAKMHATESGVVHNVALTEKDAFAQARYFLSLMPQRAGEKARESRGEANAMAREVPELLEIIPPAGNEGYDIRKVLHVVADKNTVFEMQPGFGGSIVIVLAKVGGIPVMIVANQPQVMAGAITRQAAEKATHFIELASNFGLPLITLLDNPGVMPGPQSERTGVLKAAGSMFYAQRKYTGKKIVVTLRKAFGFGSSVMGMNPWDNQAISIALPSVSLGGVPAIGGAAAAKASESEAAHMQEVQSGAWVPADSMAFDKVIHPGELRNALIEVLHRS
jgi:acetyl-CoA carboxylase carboxyltransferase component